MKTCNLFLMAVLVWFVPTFASAQDADRERLESRSRETVTDDGMEVYRLRAETNEPYNDLRVLAAPGTTDDQIDALNVGYVNYSCRINGRRRVPPMRNGRFVDGGIEPTIDFATFVATECAEGEARRELVAGAPYFIPREVIRTPGEELGDITARITAAPPSEVRTVVSETRDQAQTLITRGASPSAIGPYTAALTAAVDRVSAPSEGDRADMVFVAPHAEPVTDAASEARIASLTVLIAAAERDTAQAQGVNWFLIFVCMMLSIVLVWALLTRKRGIIDMSASQANLLRKNLNEEWQKKLDDAERKLGTANSTIKTIHGIYEDTTQEKVTLAKFPEVLKAYLVKAMGVAKTSLAITPAVVVPFPPVSSPKSSFEATENNYREIFRGVDDGALKTEEGLDRLLLKLGRMVDQSAKATLAFLLESTHQHLQNQVAWAGSVGPGLTFDAGNIEQLAAGTHPGRDRAVSEAVTRTRETLSAEFGTERAGFQQEREALTSRLGELNGFENEAARLREELEAERAKPSTDQVLEGIAKIRETIVNMWRGEFGGILDSVGPASRIADRIVNAEKVKGKFSRVRTFEKPRRKNQPADTMTINELMGPTLTDFMRTIHEDGFAKVVLVLDQLLGRTPALGDFTPAPGAHAVPMEGVEPSAEDLLTGVVPPTAAAPQIETPAGLGTEPLADQEEGETTERPLDLQSALARAAEEASPDGDDELAAEPTRFVVNPLTPEGGLPSLVPESTKPYAKGLESEEDGANGSHGSNGNSNGGGRTGEEVTKVVPLDDGGRPRRDTVRGGMTAAPQSEPPEREPAE